MWRVAANVLNKHSRTADKGLSSILGVERGANKSPYETVCYEMLHRNMEDEMGGTCSTPGRHEKFVQNFSRKT